MTHSPAPLAQPPPHSYLYMVSASTSLNHTLSPAWKFSPWSSSVATSPPPLSWGTGCRYEGERGGPNSPTLHSRAQIGFPSGSIPHSRTIFTSRVLMRGTGVTGSLVQARLVLKANSTDSVPMMVQQELSLSSARFASLGQREACRAPEWREQKDQRVPHVGRLTFLIPGSSRCQP